MILQLAGAAFRQWQCGTAHGGKRDIVAPKEKESPEVEAYMKCTWWRDNTSFLEYLRKSTTKATHTFSLVPVAVRLTGPGFAPQRRLL